MGFLGLGNFGTGFVTGFAKSVDRAVQDDMKRVQDRIDKLSDIRVQRFIKEQDEREDEVEKYRKALEKGAAVLGGAKNAAFQMKKLGNDIGLYNQFVNAFSKEKSKYGYEFNDFLKNMDSTPINPAQVKKTFTAKEYAGSIVPPLADPSTYKIPEGLTGTSGSLLKAILGEDRVNLATKIQNKTSEELAAYGVKPPNSVVDFPTLYFDDESYNLAKIENVEDKLNYLDQKILNPRLIGTEESRKRNPKSDENIMFEKLTSLKRGILKTSSESMNIDVRINVNTIRLGDLVPNTDEYNLVAAQLKSDKLEKMKIEASNSLEPNAMLNYEIAKTNIDLSDVRKDTSLTDEERNDKIQVLKDTLTTLNYELKTRTDGGETVSSKLAFLKQIREKKIISNPNYLTTESGRALQNNIETLSAIDKHFKQEGKPRYTSTNYNSSLSQFNSIYKSAVVEGLNLPGGIISIDSQSIPTFVDKLDADKKQKAISKLLEYKTAIFFGGTVINEDTKTEYTVTEGLVNSALFRDNPAMYYAHLDVAKNLGLTPPKGFTEKNVISGSLFSPSNTISSTTSSVESDKTTASSVESDKTTASSVESNKSVATQTEQAFLLPFQQGKTDAQLNLARGRKTFPNTVDGINSLIKQTIKTDGATVDLKSKILDFYSKLYPETEKEGILNYINDYKFDSLIEKNKMLTKSERGAADFEQAKGLFKNLFKGKLYNLLNEEDINTITNNKLSNDEANNLIEVVSEKVINNLSNDESIGDIQNTLENSFILDSEDKRFSAQPGGLMIGSDMFTDEGKLKLKTKEKIKKTNKIEKSPIKNIVEFEDDIYNIYSKLGLENLSFKDLSANDVEVVKDLDSAKSINQLAKIKVESMDKLRLSEDVYKVLESKVNKTIEEEVKDMSTEELTKYTKELVKKVNDILGDDRVKPKILNNILTTSRLGDFGETFEPDLSLKDKLPDIISADEMNEINALIAQGGPNVEEVLLSPKVENKVSKALNVTFGKNLDELIAAAKIVKAKVLGGADSTDNPELTEFIVETFLPTSVKNSIMAKYDSFDESRPLRYANINDIGIALKYVSVFAASPTLEKLEGYTGDIRPDVKIPLQKPPIPFSSPVNNYSGGLMSRQ